MADYMLTTVDNPFNPWTDFDEWNAWDMRSGYNSMAFLARVVVTSHELSETQQEDAIDLAIDEIVSENVSGVHKKVSNPDLPSTNDNEVDVLSTF